MGYNKRRFTKSDDKKVLHKVRKHWVVVSLSLLALLGGGTLAHQTAIHADTNNGKQLTASDTVLKNRINSSFNRVQAAQNQNHQQTSQVSSIQHNRYQPASASQINQQASDLHNRILRTVIYNCPKVGTNGSNSLKSSNGRSEIVPSNEVGSTNLNLPRGVVGKLSSDQHTLTLSGDFSQYKPNNALTGTGTPISSNLSNVTTLKLGKATNLPKSCKGMFSNMPYLSTVKTVGNWDMSKVSDISDMFYADPMLTDIEGLKDWDVSHVNTAFAMFNDDYSLSNLNPLASWNWLDNHQGYINLGAMFLNDDSVKDWSPIQYHWQFLNNSVDSGRMFTNTGVSPDLSLHSNLVGHYVFSTPVTTQAQATFKFTDWRTGRLVGQSILSVPTGAYSNYTLSEIGVPSAYHLVNRADGYNPNKPTAGDNYDPQIDVSSNPDQNVFSIPVVPDSVIHYGYWGNAHYELTSTGTLRLFNGDMNTTHTPWIFNQLDAQAGNSFGEHKATERGYYNNGGNRRRTYGDDVLKIKTSNVVAPKSCQGLFGGSSIYFGYSHYNSDKGENSKDGATGHFCNVESVDLSGLDTSGTTNMAGMLRGEYNLTNVKFGGNFDTHNVTNMADMFDDDSDITSLDLNSFNTQNCNDLHGMFYNMGNLRDLDIYNFVINSGTNVSDMFSMSYHKSPSNGNDSSASGEQNSIDSSLREIDIGPRTQFTANDNNGLNNKNLFGGKFFDPKTGQFTDKSDSVKNTVEGHGAWVNVDPNTGQYVSDLSELANVNGNPKHAGNWVYYSDIIPYQINFVDVLNNQPFNKFGPVLNIKGYTLRGLKGATWVPIDYYNDPNHLPADRFGIHYRLAPNQGLTVPVTIPNQQINIGVYAPEDVIDANVWGTADWFVFGSNKNNDNAYGEKPSDARSLYLIDGNLEQDHAPHNTNRDYFGHQIDNLVQYLPYIKQVHATNVEAPTNAAHTFSGQEYNSNHNPNFGNEFKNVSDFDLSDFRTQYTSDMDNMFSDLPHLKELDLGNFDTSATYSMRNMFAGDQNLQSLRLTHFTMGENGVAVPTSDMFKSDRNLNSLTIGNHTVFQSNSSLVDHNNWGLTGSPNPVDLTNNGTHQSGTYLREDNLTRIKVNYKFGNTLVASDRYSMPVENGQLNSLDVPMIPNYTFEPSDHPATFTDDDGSITVPVDEKGKWGNSRWLMNSQGKMLIQEGNLDTNQWSGPVKGQGGSANVSTWPLGRSDVTSITVSDVQAPNNMSRVFAGLPKLRLLDLTGLNGIDLDNLSEAFASDPQLSDIQGLYKISPGKHANMSGLLANDPSLQQVDVADMPMGSVDNFSRMFANDPGLQSIDGLNTWLTSNVSDMSQMFASDLTLTNLDLSSFDTWNVTKMANMLNNLDAIQIMKIGSDTRLYGANDLRGRYGDPNLSGQWFNQSTRQPYDLNSDYDSNRFPVAGTYYKHGVVQVTINFIDQNGQVVDHMKIARSAQIMNDCNVPIGQQIPLPTNDAQAYTDGLDSHYHLIPGQRSTYVVPHHNSSFNLYVTGNAEQVHSNVKVVYENSDGTTTDRPAAQQVPVTLYGYNGNYVAFNPTGIKAPSDYALDKQRTANPDWAKLQDNNVIWVTGQNSSTQAGEPTVYMMYTKASLRVVYLNQDGQKVGCSDVIRGHAGQQVNVTDPSDGGSKVPTGYQLNGKYSYLNGKNSDNGFDGQDQDTVYQLRDGQHVVYLHVHGLPVPASVKVYRFLEDANGQTSTLPPVFHSLKKTIQKPVGGVEQVNDSNGSDVEINPAASDLRPRGYSVDYSRDSVRFARISYDTKTRNYVTSPSRFVFYYRKNQTGGAPIILRYIDENTGSQVEDPLILNGNLGQKVDATESMPRGINANDVAGENVPYGYSIDPNSSLMHFPASDMVNTDKNHPVYEFTASPQAINIPVQGNVVTKTLHLRVIERDSLNQKTLYTSDVPVKISGRIGQHCEISPYGFSDGGIISSIQGLSHQYDAQAPVDGHALDFRIPSDSHATNSDADLPIWINENGQLSPLNHFQYTYVNYQAPQIGTVKIHYVASDTLANQHNGDGKTYLVNGHQYAELDYESDKGTAGSPFDLAPYTNDLPEQLQSYYTSGDQPAMNVSGNTIQPSDYRWNFTNGTVNVYIKVTPTDNGGNNPIIIN